MAPLQDRGINGWMRKFLKVLKQEYAPSKVILFGSRARGDNLHESDVDLIIVSKKFAKISWPRRIGNVAALWEGLVDIEPLCYTPKEFDSKVKEHGIVRQAIKEGIALEV